MNSTTLELLKSSKSNEWFTPPEHLVLVRNVLEQIDLDPASSHEANQFVQAKIFLTEKEGENSYKSFSVGGIAWFGNIYCNPPYGGLAGKFVNKALEEYESKRANSIILCLSGYAYETKWFRPILSNLNIPICWVYGRVKFLRYRDKEKLKSQTSTVGTIYVYLGEEKEKFKNEFKKIGAIR